MKRPYALYYRMIWKTYDRVTETSWSYLGSFSTLEKAEKRLEGYRNAWERRLAYSTDGSIIKPAVVRYEYKVEARELP